MLAWRRHQKAVGVSANVMARRLMKGSLAASWLSSSIADADAHKAIFCIAMSNGCFSLWQKSNMAWPRGSGKPALGRWRRQQ